MITAKPDHERKTTHGTRCRTIHTNPEKPSHATCPHKIDAYSTIRWLPYVFCLLSSPPLPFILSFCFRVFPLMTPNSFAATTTVPEILLCVSNPPPPINAPHYYCHTKSIPSLVEPSIGSLVYQSSIPLTIANLRYYRHRQATFCVSLAASLERLLHVNCLTTP
jgi:hypothetical protein